jgi:hypothetical protein
VLHDDLVMVVKDFFFFMVTVRHCSLKRVQCLIFHGNSKTVFTYKGSVPESAVNHM